MPNPAEPVGATAENPQFTERNSDSGQATDTFDLWAVPDDAVEVSDDVLDSDLLSRWAQLSPENEPISLPEPPDPQPTPATILPGQPTALAAPWPSRRSTAILVGAIVLFFFLGLGLGRITNTATESVPGIAPPAAPAPGKFIDQVKLLHGSTPARLESTGTAQCPMYLVSVQQKAFPQPPSRGCFFLR